MIKQGQILRACNEVVGTKVVPHPSNSNYETFEQIILAPSALIFVDDCRILEDMEYNQSHYSIKATVGNIRDVYFVSDVSSNDFEVLQEVGE